MFFKVALTSLILGALYVNALSVPVAREPVPEPAYADTSDGLLSREAEPETQELDARVLPLVAAGLGAAGLLGTVGGGAVAATGLADKLRTIKNKNKREILDDLLSREVQDWAKWAESVRNQASKRERWHI